MGAILILGSTTAYAGSEYQSYSTTVAPFNGNGYTSYQIKDTIGTAAGLKSETVGGNYTVDVRMIDSDGSAGSWCRDVTD